MTLPVPLTFRLPGDQWSPRKAATLGVANADFVAVRTIDDDSGYQPVLTITGGVRKHDVTLGAIADDSLDVLRAQATDVELLARDHIGDRVPGITQLLGCRADAAGRTYDLRQGQLLLDLADVDDPSRRAVVVCTVTCTTDQMAVVTSEFQELIATIRVGRDDSGVAT